MLTGPTAHGLLAFVLLSAAFTGNVLLLQPVPRAHVVLWPTGSPVETPRPGEPIAAILRPGPGCVRLDAELAYYRVDRQAGSCHTALHTDGHAWRASRG